MRAHLPDWSIVKRSTLLAVAVCASLARSVLAAPAPLPATPSAWRQAALADIDEACRITLGNHAGAYYPGNPGFLQHLNEAQRHSRALAGRVRDEQGYIAVLADFTAGLHDCHAGVAPTLPATRAPIERWPGFLTAWRRDALFVAASVAGEPPADARVVSCDGVPIDDVIHNNVFAF